MTTTFVVMALTMGLRDWHSKAHIQSWAVLLSSPFLRSCHCRDGRNTIHRRPNEISIWAQIPLHIFLAANKIFGFMALNDFAYQMAPTNMEALVKAFEQSTAALGAALGMAPGLAFKDPARLSEMKKRLWRLEQ
ncbi:hypothetical protein K458DRAFT_381347 [Lentithecium fluviatile CBS 122367]|uniref:Uncharacterized protein n=1 Tax=Lentithecium fluviatile CBS 122367 TaxID=1168545 RepID=A0A6G1JMM8_9PLEO|nr:hypothetical protein K458DRAFT_381347 [Lentithecium fluviatile CBS 122367]